MNFVICLAVWFLAATGTVSHKQATFVSSFQAIQLNNALFSILFFFSSSFSVFNVFLPLCCLSFVFTYLWSVFYSCSVSFLFLSFSPSLGIGMKTKPVIFFLQRALNISVLHFFSSLFMCSLFFFPRPLWCVCGFVIIPFGWAHKRRCAGPHALTHTTRSLFSYQRHPICNRTF